MSDAGKAGGAGRVVLVGHCGPDSFLLEHAVRRALPGAKVIRADDESELAAAAQDADLLLINRVLGGSFREDSGVDLIRHRNQSGATVPPMMLISDYPDAQAAAEAAGAAPGFGKREVYSDRTMQRLRAAVAMRQ